MTETSDILIGRIETALARLETVGADAARTKARLDELETLVAASVGELDELLAAAR